MEPTCRSGRSSRLNTNITATYTVFPYCSRSSAAMSNVLDLTINQVSLAVSTNRPSWHGSCIRWRPEGRVTEMTEPNQFTAPPVQKVVVINGNTEVLGMLESVLDSGRYDMVFVEPGDRAYSQIKKVLPNLVILCTRIERLDGFQILTMLKLDPDTCDIPVLTYTTEAEGQDFGTVLSQVTEDDDSLFPSRAAMRMN
jgi:CheY-like chemotaxis protein